MKFEKGDQSAEGTARPCESDGVRVCLTRQGTACGTGLASIRFWSHSPNARASSSRHSYGLDAMGRRLVTIEMEQHAGGGAAGWPGPVAVDVPCGFFLKVCIARASLSGSGKVYRLYEVTWRETIHNLEKTQHITQKKVKRGPSTTKLSN
jgi:hypothetical protein